MTTTKMWMRSPATGTYRLHIDGEYTRFNIQRTPSGRITKRFGWDVFNGIEKLAHYDTLKEAKQAVEELY